MLCCLDASLSVLTLCCLMQLLMMLSCLSYIVFKIWGRIQYFVAGVFHPFWLCLYHTEVFATTVVCDYANHSHFPSYVYH
jgi:hypothetical protein